MRKKHLLIAIIGGLTFFACKKEEKVVEPTTTTPTVTTGFTYSENGSSTKTNANASYASSPYRTIYGGIDSNTVIQINLSALSAAKYEINGTTNSFTYIKPGSSSVWIGEMGTVNITKNDGKTLSGTFTITKGGGIDGVNSVSGEFIQVSIK